MPHEAKALTVEEERYLLISHLSNLVDIWNKEEDMDSKEKLEGLLHSVLSALDGCAIGLPGYQLIPIIADGDTEFSKENNFDYHEENDIGGSLHELYAQHRHKKIPRPKNMRSFGDYLVDEANKLGF